MKKIILVVAIAISLYVSYCFGNKMPRHVQFLRTGVTYELVDNGKFFAAVDKQGYVRYIAAWNKVYDRMTLEDIENMEASY